MWKVWDLICTDKFIPDLNPARRKTKAHTQKRWLFIESMGGNELSASYFAYRLVSVSSDKRAIYW